MFQIWTLVFILGSGEMVYYPALTETECDVAASALEHIQEIQYLACEVTTLYEEEDQ